MLLAAEKLGASLPPLLVAAERVAATVAQGVHGRRRMGGGESFWQFRPFIAGDSSARIDWRQSAKSDRLYVRDMEWEAAQTICLWRDASPSMGWKSSPTLPQKQERAELLLLALSALLLRAGEQIRLLATQGRAFAGRRGLENLATSLALTGDTPATATHLPRYSTAILFGDFLGPLEETRATLARLAALPARGHLVQILDPAELSLPYEGRVRFTGLEGEGSFLAPRVDGVRGAYTAALANHQAELARICAAAGFSHLLHRTDHAPQTALLALWMTLSGEHRGRAA